MSSGPIASGLFDGRRIGVFSDRYTATSTPTAIARLATLGHAPVAHVDPTASGVGSDHDRTRPPSVPGTRASTSIVPFVSGSSLARMLRAADAIGYPPSHRRPRDR